jgi:hypothetical protein
MRNHILTYVVSNNSSTTHGINWRMTVKNNILHDTGITCTVAVRNHCQGRQLFPEKVNTVEHSTVAIL